MGDCDVCFVDKNGNEGIFLTSVPVGLAERIAAELVFEGLTPKAWITDADGVPGTVYA